MLLAPMTAGEYCSPVQGGQITWKQTMQSGLWCVCVYACMCVVSKVKCGPFFVRALMKPAHREMMRQFLKDF